MSSKLRNVILQFPSEDTEEKFETFSRQGVIRRDSENDDLTF